MAAGEPDRASAEADDGPEIRAEDVAPARRKRNLVTLLVLVGWVALIYIVAIVKMSEGS